MTHLQRPLGVSITEVIVLPLLVLLLFSFSNWSVHVVIQLPTATQCLPGVPAEEWPPRFSMRKINVPYCSATQGERLLQRVHSVIRAGAAIPDAPQERRVVFRQLQAIGRTDAPHFLVTQRVPQNVTVVLGTKDPAPLIRRFQGVQLGPDPLKSDWQSRQHTPTAFTSTTGAGLSGWACA